MTMDPKADKAVAAYIEDAVARGWHPMAAYAGLMMTKDGASAEEVAAMLEFSKTEEGLASIAKTMGEPEEKA